MFITILIVITVLGVSFYSLRKFYAAKDNFITWAMRQKQLSKIAQYKKAVEFNPTEENQLLLKKYETFFEALSINRYVRFLKETGRYEVCGYCGMPKDLTYPTCPNCSTTTVKDMSNSRKTYLMKEAEAQSGEAMIEWMKLR